MLRKNVPSPVAGCPSTTMPTVTAPAGQPSSGATSNCHTSPLSCVASPRPSSWPAASRNTASTAAVSATLASVTSAKPQSARVKYSDCRSPAPVQPGCAVGNLTKS